MDLNCNQTKLVQGSTVWKNNNNSMCISKGRGSYCCSSIFQSSLDEKICKFDQIQIRCGILLLRKKQLQYSQLWRWGLLLCTKIKSLLLKAQNSFNSHHLVFHLCLSFSFFLLMLLYYQGRCQASIFFFFSSQL